MKCKRFLSISILGVFLLIGFVYYTTVFIFIEDWVGLQSSAGSLNVIIFTFLVSLCFFSFFVCVLTDPGYVPASYVPDIEESGAPDEERKKNLTVNGTQGWIGANTFNMMMIVISSSLSLKSWNHGFSQSLQSRHCDKCSTFKPPRAHHCRVCRRCVLRMDHHCIWINNCVGYWNYKAFFTLVLYATIGSIYSTVMIVACSLQKDWQFSERVSLKIFYVTSGVMMVALSLTLGTLLGWHIYLITQNMTTIEYYEGVRAAWLARKSGQSCRHPFDLSVYKNITLVLGPNMLKWLCPTALSHLKDGLNFPTSRDRL